MHNKKQFAQKIFCIKIPLHKKSICTKIELHKKQSKQAGAVLGQAQLKLELDLTLMNLH